MGKLTDEQKAEAYRLYTEEKLTYGKISQQMGVSVPTIVRAVSELETARKADDLMQAPLACDLTADALGGTAAATVPAAVIAAVSEKIAAVEAKIEVAVAGISLKQRELDAMRAELESLKKWKEAQKC